MTVAEIRTRMSARELAEWNQFLMLKDDDVRPKSLEADLMSVFGGPRG